MNKKIMKIEPFFEARMWGGTRLIEQFHYVTDVHPIGEVYNVVALKNHADCIIAGENMTLSTLYETNPEWFLCDTKELPIRVNILDPLADLSVQIHPNDEFAKKYNGGRGKPEAWVILDTPEDGYIQFGHTAITKEEFAQKVDNKDFKSLLKYLKAIKDAFIDIPSGTLHAIGKGVLTYNISRNADCTLRLYDYDRIDPSTREKRQLHILNVINEVTIPDRSTEFVMFPSIIENGCKVTRFWDEPGLYTSMRFQIEKEGTYEHPRFAFYTCVSGEGMVNETLIRKGETLFVPDGMGTLKFKGKLDLFLASYWNITK